MNQALHMSENNSIIDALDNGISVYREMCGGKNPKQINLPEWAVEKLAEEFYERYDIRESGINLEHEIWGYYQDIPIVISKGA